MPTDEFLLILKTCFLNVGLNPVERSPIRLEVFVQGDRLVGEVFFIDNNIDGMMYTSCNEYGDLFEGICEGVRTGFKEGVKWQSNRG